MAATFIVVLSGTKTKEIWNSVWHSEPGKIQSPGKNEEIWINTNIQARHLHTELILRASITSHKIRGILHGVRFAENYSL